MTRFTLALLILALALPAAADTIIVPHMLEPSGSLAVEPRPGSVDVRLHAFDTGSLRDDWLPGSNTLQVRIFAADGSVYPAADGGDLCAPCSFPVGESRTANFSLVEVMVAAGISTMAPDGGYMELEVTGRAPQDVQLTARTVVFEPGGGTGGSPIALRVPCGGSGGGGLPTGKRIHVSTGLTEGIGAPAELAGTSDASLMVACAGEATAATVNLHLFDQSTGAPLVNAEGETICNPCSFPMGGERAPRKRTLALEELITAGGGVVPQDGSMELVEPESLDVPDATSVADVARRFGKLRNHPDPFNPQTTLFFELEREDTAVLSVLDLKGRVVRTLETGRLGAGAHEVRWDGRDDRGEPQPAGVYLARLQTGAFTTVEKLALIK